MEEETLVKINTASADEISRLFGIGQKLSKRIVEHRKDHGDFHNPDDLVKVKGISKNLAITIAPLIDWEIPSQSEDKKEREWDNVAVCFLGSIAIIWFIFNRQLPNFYYTLDLPNNSPGYYIYIFINCSILALQIFLFISLVVFGFSSLSKSIKLGILLNRISMFFGSLGLLCTLFVGIGNIIYYQFLTNNGWSELIKNQVAFSAAAGLIVLSLFISPLVIGVYSRKLTTSILFARMFDVSVTISAPIVAWMIWAFRFFMPTWFLVIVGLVGVFMAYSGFKIIHTGKSFYQIFLADLFGEQIIQKSSGKFFWQTWVNIRLPNAEQQKELKEALDEMYPPSKFKSIAGTIFFGAGGWIIITTITSIIDWFIQRNLDKIVP